MIRCARSKIVTAERGLPMLNAWPTASGRSRQARTPLHHVGDVAPGADLRAVAMDRQVAAGERSFDEGADRAATDLARAENVEGTHGDGRQAELVVVGVRHVLACKLRDGVCPARLPTEPIVETWPSLTRKACVPKTSLVEKSTNRSRVSSVAGAASSAL